MLNVMLLIATLGSAAGIPSDVEDKVGELEEGVDAPARASLFGAEVREAVARGCGGTLLGGLLAFVPLLLVGVASGVLVLVLFAVGTAILSNVPRTNSTAGLAGNVLSVALIALLVAGAGLLVVHAAMATLLAAFVGWRAMPAATRDGSVRIVAALGAVAASAVAPAGVGLACLLGVAGFGGFSASAMIYAGSSLTLPAGVAVGALFFPLFFGGLAAMAASLALIPLSALSAPLLAVPSTALIAAFGTVWQSRQEQSPHAAPVLDEDNWTAP